MEMITILSVESVSDNISMHSLSLSLSRSVAGLVMAFSLIDICFSPSARALALFDFQSIYLDLRNPETTILRIFVPNLRSFNVFMKFLMALSPCRVITISFIAFNMLDFEQNSSNLNTKLSEVARWLP
jgi:hypothetical protein